VKKIFFIFFICFFIDYLYTDLLHSEARIPAQIKIYFTDPPYSSGNIEKELKNFVDSASNTVIYAAFYRIDLTTITYALNQALNRGCTVYVICDYDEGNTSAYQTLTVNKKLGNTSGLMHNKFCVIKDSAVWTGSWNPTENDTTKNNNNALVIYSSSLAQIYETEFMEMWSDKFGQAKTAWQNSSKEVDVEGIKMRVYFSPYNQPQTNEAIKTVLDQTEKGVYFALYSFTDDLLGGTLIDLVNKRKKVYGIFDLEQFGIGSEYEKLRSAGTMVTFDGNQEKMHHKFAIIDPFCSPAKIITGSFNWSVSANTENDENLLIIYSPEIAEVYYEEFLKLWRQTGGVVNVGLKAIENLTLYPSPAENYLNICFDLGNNVKNVEINIYNLVGEKVNTVSFTDFFCGIRNHKKIFLTNDSGRNLASGVYLVKVKAETPDGTFYQIKKFAVIR